MPCAARTFPSCGGHSIPIVKRSRATAGSSRGGARTSRPRCSPSPRAVRAPTCASRSPPTPGSSACSPESRTASSIRSAPSGSSSRRCSSSMAPTIADIEAARQRLAGIARETPVYPTETFSQLTGRPVFLKAENLQRTGSFKIRGAYNTIATLGEKERAAGVVAASAGNHGQAVAWAAREAGISATIFMPQDAPMAKVEATRSYGGTTELAGATFEDAVAAAQAHVEATGATLVHAFEDERVVAGQGTIGLELAEQAPDAETVVIPIGGGGLAAGISLVLKDRRPDVRVVGVLCQPGYTIADGIAVKHKGE